MAGFFYKLGKLAGPKIRKAQWVWAEATGSEAEAIEAEYRVGAEMAQAVRSSMSTLCTDSEITDLLQTTGNSLKPFIKNQLRKFQLDCISSENPQAFCLPGGFVFLSDSMIDLCDRDKNLIAFICAHEMAHIIKGHAIQRMIANSVINQTARRVSGNVLNKLGIDFLQSAYSQDNEYEADKFALCLTTAAGFESRAGLLLFEKLCQFEHKPLLGRYFSTHPPCQHRIEHLRRELKDL